MAERHLRCRSQCAPAGGRGGEHLNDPGTSQPVLLDVLRCLLCPEFPERVTTVPLLLITCGVWDVPFPLELALDLAAEGLLIRFDGQEHVGPLLQAPQKIWRVVCRASAWISTPSRSSVDSSSLRAARSLDSPVS